MKTVSVTDLKLIDVLSHLNYVEMIHPNNDDLVNSQLAILGFDINAPMEYRAYQHRNLQGQVVINFLIAGEINQDRKILTGPFGSFEDRKIVSGMKDRSLFEELHSLGSRCHDYGLSSSLDDNVPVRDEDEDKMEEQRILAEIKMLEDVLLHVRGTQFKLDGSFKTPYDYKVPEVIPKPRRKKQRKIVEGV